MNQRIMYILTRTPLHVGAGASVGAIDQPIQRERHTGLPIIPASTLKGVFAAEWDDTLAMNDNGKRSRGKGDAAWLFGSDDSKRPHAGAVQFSEARVLAFPVRSAKGCFAWLTSPLVLNRFARDTGNTGLVQPEALSDEEVVCDEKADINLDGKLVLEEYAFTRKAGVSIQSLLIDAMAAIMPSDEVWRTFPRRLAIVSDGMFAFFARNVCEVAQHIRIDDATGTVAKGALFNQENVPSETLFYSAVSFFGGRDGSGKSPDQAASVFCEKVKGKAMQFGGDASTGLGFCSIAFTEKRP